MISVSLVFGMFPLILITDIAEEAFPAFWLSGIAEPAPEQDQTDMSRPVDRRIKELQHQQMGPVNIELLRTQAKPARDTVDMRIDRESRHSQRKHHHDRSQ